MNNSSQNQGQPIQGNPLLRYYDIWSQTTPAVTRSSTIALVILYLFSWIIDLTDYLGNIPYFTIYYIELYRIILSPFVGNSLLSVIFILLFYPTMASRLEQSMGSGSFLAFLTTLSVVTNIIFALICLIMSVLAGNQSPMLLQCAGFWSVCFSLIVVECMKTPDAPRRMLFIPVDIPAKYFPLALYAFFMLLGGMRFDDLVAIGVGYAYAFGYLEKFRLSDSMISQQETSGILKSLTSSSGWIGASNAMGGQAFMPLSQTDPDQEGGNGGNMPTIFPNSMRQTQANVDPFPGQGHKLGNNDSNSSSGIGVGAIFGGSSNSGSSALDKEQMKAMRLAALGGGGGNGV